MTERLAVLAGHIGSDPFDFLQLRSSLSPQHKVTLTKFSPSSNAWSTLAKPI